MDVICVGTHSNEYGIVKIDKFQLTLLGIL